MEEVLLELGEDQKGKFYLMQDDTEMGRMEFGIQDNLLTVYHTEVSPEFEGRGLAKILLQGMVSYARAQHLKVKPLCPYVLARFKRQEEEFADIWEKG